MIETHGGYSGHQIAPALPIDTHATAFVIDAVESAHSATTGGEA